LIPATGVMDTEGDAMPEPNTGTPGLFGQKTKPEKSLKEVLDVEDKPDFGMGFYDQ